MSSLQAQQLPYKISFLEGNYQNTAVLTGRLDSSLFFLETKKIRNTLFAQGHLLANIDRLEQGDSLLADIFVGPIYYWHSMGVQNIPQEYLSKAGYRTRDFVNSQINYRQFNRLVEKIIGQATNNGYPFASLQLADIEVKHNSIKGILAYEPGPLVRYDSLTILPPVIVRPSFMAAYLNIKKGDLFSYASLSDMEARLNALSYAKLDKPTEVKFANNLCNISFGLEKIRANRFDAIIGFLPNQGAGEGLRLTGYADLHLENLFRAGKSLTFQWQQFQTLSQTLLLNYNHPNLFRSPLGLGLEANLIKQDTAFLNTNIAFDVFYVRKNFEFAATSNIISSRQLSNPTDTTMLPSIADYNMNMFGLHLRFNNLGNLPNPRSGMRLSTFLKFGNKNINRNPSLPESVYEGLAMKSSQFHFQINTEINRGLGRFFAIHANFLSGAVWNGDRLFVNDLMRIGGVQSLRGFNELDLYVSSYALLRMELRLLMNEASRIFLFYDQAATYNEISDLPDTPLGFGAGLYLRTGGGDLQLIYALGVSQQQSLSLDQSKIHLGYVATF